MTVSESQNYTLTKEIGGVGLKRSGGYVLEEFNPRLYGTRAAETFREMYDNNAVIGAACYAIDILLRGATWHTEPVDETPQALECCDFVDSCFNDMAHTHSDWMQEVLSCIPYGWAWFEKCYKKRDGYNEDSDLDSRYKDGRLGFSKIALRSQTSLSRWEFGENDKVLGMWQRPSWVSSDVFIPSRKSVNFILRGAKGSPEGRSLLRNAYWSWYYLKKLEIIEGIGLERDLAGFPVMEMPITVLNGTDAPSIAAVAAARAFVKGVRMDEEMGGLIPSELDREGKPTGYKLRLLATGGKNQTGIQAAIVRYEQRIAMTLMANFLLMGMDKVGSFSLHASATDLFGVGLGSILDTVEQIQNRNMVADLCRLNGFPEEVWPTRKHGDVETQPLTEIAAFINSMVGAGVLTPDETLENHIRELATLPAKDDMGYGDALDMLPEGPAAPPTPPDQAPAAGETGDTAMGAAP